MSIKIQKKVSHREWQEVTLTPEQFIKFDSLYFSEENDDDLKYKCELYPTFLFEKGNVFADEIWDIDDNGRVSTSSFQCGVMGFSEVRGNYAESYYGRSKTLGQLIAVKFTVDDDMIEIFKRIE